MASQSKMNHTALNFSQQVAKDITHEAERYTVRGSRSFDEVKESMKGTFETS